MVIIMLLYFFFALHWLKTCLYVKCYMCIFYDVPDYMTNRGYHLALRKICVLFIMRKLFLNQNIAGHESLHQHADKSHKVTDQVPTIMISVAHIPPKIIQYNKSTISVMML